LCSPVSKATPAVARLRQQAHERHAEQPRGNNGPRRARRTPAQQRAFRVDDARQSSRKAARAREGNGSSGSAPEIRSMIGRRARYSEGPRVAA
jgi:hypothetical protein